MLWTSQNVLKFWLCEGNEYREMDGNEDYRVKLLRFQVGDESVSLDPGRPLADYGYQ